MWDALYKIDLTSNKNLLPAPVYLWHLLLLNGPLYLLVKMQNWSDKQQLAGIRGGHEIWHRPFTINNSQHQQLIKCPEGERWKSKRRHSGGRINTTLSRGKTSTCIHFNNSKRDGDTSRFSEFFVHPCIRLLWRFYLSPFQPASLLLFSSHHVSQKLTFTRHRRNVSTINIFSFPVSCGSRSSQRLHFLMQGRVKIVQIFTWYFISFHQWNWRSHEYALVKYCNNIKETTWREKMLNMYRSLSLSLSLCSLVFSCARLIIDLERRARKSVHFARPRAGGTTSAANLFFGGENRNEGDCWIQMSTCALHPPPLIRELISRWFSWPWECQSSHLVQWCEMRINQSHCVLRTDTSYDCTLIIDSIEIWSSLSYICLFLSMRN